MLINCPPVGLQEAGFPLRRPPPPSCLRTRTEMALGEAGGAPSRHQTGCSMGKGVLIKGWVPPPNKEWGVSMAEKAEGAEGFSLALFSPLHKGREEVDCQAYSSQETGPHKWQPPSPGLRVTHRERERHTRSRKLAGKGHREITLQAHYTGWLDSGLMAAGCVPLSVPPHGCGGLDPGGLGITPPLGRC